MKAILAILVIAAFCWFVLQPLAESTRFSNELNELNSCQELLDWAKERHDFTDPQKKEVAQRFSEIVEKTGKEIDFLKFKESFGDMGIRIKLK